MNRQRHQRHHLAVFAVRFEVGITAINLLKIANQGAEYRLIIRRTSIFSAVTFGINRENQGSEPLRLRCNSRYSGGGRFQRKNMTRRVVVSTVVLKERIELNAPRFEDALTDRQVVGFRLLLPSTDWIHGVPSVVSRNHCPYHNSNRVFTACATASGELISQVSSPSVVIAIGVFTSVSHQFTPLVLLPPR